MHQVGERLVCGLCDKLWRAAGIGAVTVSFCIGNLCRPEHCLYTILYADDILLLAPSVTLLERLLHDCEYVIKLVRYGN